MKHIIPGKFILRSGTLFYRLRPFPNTAVAIALFQVQQLKY